VPEEQPIGGDDQSCGGEGKLASLNELMKDVLAGILARVCERSVKRV
jgi:hypothetical protein